MNTSFLKSLGLNKVSGSVGVGWVALLNSTTGTSKTLTPLSTTETKTITDADFNDYDILEIKGQGDGGTALSATVTISN